MSNVIPPASMQLSPQAIPSPGIKYSDEGKQIALDVYAKASEQNLAKDANRVLWDGFNKIQNSSSATADEKAIAAYGSAVSQVTLDTVEHNRLAFPIIKSIVYPDNGPVGNVLGNIIYDTANNVKLAKTANQALWKGYDVILAHPGVTEVQKAIAEVGRQVSYITLDETEHNRIAYPLMRAISSSNVASAAGPAIAAAVYESAANTKFAKSANQVLWKSYNVIINSAETTDEEKAVARVGNKAASNTLNVVEHNKIAFPLLKAISADLQGPMGNIVAKSAYDAAQNVQYAETANRIFWSAYSEMLSNPKVAEAERAIAALGDAVSHNSMVHTEHNKLNYPLFKIMSAPVSTAVPQALAYAATAAAQNTSDTKTSALVLREGFKAILSRADASEIQKHFAQKGLDVDKKPQLSNTDANTLRYTIMDMIKKSTDIAVGSDPAAVALSDPAKLREQVKGLQDTITESEQQIKTLEKENRDDQPLLNQAIDSYNSVVKKYNLGIRVNRYLWIGGLAGAVAAFALSQPLLFLPMGAAGLTHLFVDTMKKKLITRDSEMKGIEQRISQRSLNVDLQRGKVELYRMQLDLLKPQMETLDMAQAVSRPEPGAASQVINNDDDSFVVIGGLKIDKKMDSAPPEHIGADHQSESSGTAQNPF
ncbi:MAG: hypothetical protein AB2L14_32615 [Candidatus Xenobiia bacterium LiM19]